MAAKYTFAVVLVFKNNLEQILCLLGRKSTGGNASVYEVVQ